MREDYQNNIEKLRQERAVCRERFNVITGDIEHTLNSFALDTGKTLISWNQLAESKIDDVYVVNEKVRFVKKYHDDNKMEFKTYMEPGGEFGLHEHDVLEVVFIESGHLIETQRGDKVYEKGETVIYASYEKHKAKSLVDSVYTVTFKKQSI